MTVQRIVATMMSGSWHRGLHGAARTLVGTRGYQVACVVAAATAVILPTRSVAQLTRDIPPAVANERLLLDSYLRVGRTEAGTRLNEPQFRQLYANRIPNPLARVLQQADPLKLTDAQADSISILNRNFVRGSDSTWGAVAHYLVALPASYDIGAAWAHVGPGFTTVVGRLLAAATAEKALLTRDQLAQLPPAVMSLLDSTCIRSLDPSGGPGVRIGGAGALGIGRIRGC